VTYLSNRTADDDSASAYGLPVDNCLRAHARPRIGEKLLAMPPGPASALKSLQPAINMLARAHHHRDSLTCRHEQRVAAIAIAIARTMRLSANRIDALHLAALVHDIGQLGIPSEIVGKADRLSEPEQALMQTHCDIGRDILQQLDTAGSPVAEIVYQHHERMEAATRAVCVAHRSWKKRAFSPLPIRLTRYRRIGPIGRHCPRTLCSLSFADWPTLRSIKQRSMRAYAMSWVVEHVIAPHRPRRQTTKQRKRWSGRQDSNATSCNGSRLNGLKIGGHSLQLVPAQILDHAVHHRRCAEHALDHQQLLE
jgi:hypothetical protein